ncbi:SAMHD1 [Bugula neritina]|uniref:SAMHD1 n=1 Tax=Bugula neritina TaxID=10212 RepID=A0A7J7K4J4_BUGNE|nr:SAMHD1 [Bugula neritina]
MLQLGTLHYVYPGANGTRFDHSLGVYHLAGKVVKFLKEHQPELNISEEDCLCVELAGLCHDLGHGPFSNFFEKLLVPALNPNNGRRWKHTDTSLQILDLIYKTDEHK